MDILSWAHMQHNINWLIYYFYWNFFLTMDSVYNYMQLDAAAMSQEDPQTDESVAAGW